MAHIAITFIFIVFLVMPTLFEFNPSVATYVIPLLIRDHLQLNNPATIPIHDNIVTLLSWSWLLG